MKKILAALLLTALAIPAAMADSPTEVRTQSFKKILRAFEPMGMVVRDRDPYNKDAFIKQADTLKQLSAEPFNHFPQGSIDGKSRAKPEIWSQPAKFQSAKDNFLKSVNDLSSTARSGDLAAIKKSYGVVAQSCKACHDSFRGPER
ncbi:cytochrome c [uncultured Aquitalea sp.]|uniref:c-type cytochrome n=1 Tax=uncultured Aquitalea sp. TaxID=540272 RepID=UPI0025DA9E3A|nr:cytochrome c [uncultured Aquitalea sp.]